MNALWKCPLCGKTLREKNLPPFSIQKVSYDPENPIRGNLMYVNGSLRSRKCERHRGTVYMCLSVEL